MNPKLVVESITFNNGDIITINENSITIFVGANNVGKTAALKNIHMLSHMSGFGVKHDVVANLSLKKVGSESDFISFLKKTKIGKNYKINIAGREYNIDSTEPCGELMNQDILEIFLLKQC